MLFRSNGAYYSKGTIKTSKSYTSSKQLLSESETTLLETPVALPLKETSTIYEIGNENSCITSSTEYEYGNYGNVTKLTQTFGNGEILIGEFGYCNPDEENYIVGFPEKIEVKVHLGFIKY